MPSFNKAAQVSPIHITSTGPDGKKLNHDRLPRNANREEVNSAVVGMSKTLPEGSTVKVYINVGNDFSLTRGSGGPIPKVLNEYQVINGEAIDQSLIARLGRFLGKG